jgi:hypothetical protein
MHDLDERARLLESEIERRLSERFAALREEFERLRLESDGRWAGFASRFKQRVSGIVPTELLSPAGERRGPGAGHLSIAAARDLDAASSQVQILERLLEICRRHSSRAILLVLRQGVFTVWKAVGFSGGAASREAARASLPLSGHGILARVVDGAPCRLPAGNPVSERLSCADAVDAVLVPMTIGEKVSGALYADAAAGKKEDFDPEAIALLSFLAGLLVERLPVRKLKPSPALRAIEPAPAESLPAEEAQYDTEMLSLWREAPEAAPAAEHARPAAPAGREPAAVSPAGARRLTGPLAPADEEEKRAEARRFAQLLVNEIKLYNEQAVQEGRAEGNLYRRLKEEIDLSRQMYEERIPETDRAGSDFLYEELVRILANGHAEALGL